MLTKSLPRHMKMMHANENEKYSPVTEAETGITKNCANKFPIQGCPGGGKDKHSIYRHFCLRHHQATSIIKEDGKLPRCPLCGYFTHDLERHQKTKACRKGQARRSNEEKQAK